jgi:eukaryotic translation initiation factor 2C
VHGTGRPAHYIVLRDDIFRHFYGNTAAAELEKLTHGLSYMFGRATGPVSYCTPAYYADLACTRARCYLAELRRTSVSLSVQNAQQGQNARAPVQVKDWLRDTMFYI